MGYRTPDRDHAVHYGLPSPWLTIIFSLDDGVESASELAALVGAKPDPLVAAGLHTQTSYVLERADQTGIQLAVHPLACRALFGLPAVELSVTDYDGREVLGRRALITQDQLTETSDWSQAFRLLGDHLHASLEDHERLPGVRSEIRHAWNLLEVSDGRRPISEVADAVGVTARHLGTLFHREVGRSPKTVAQLFRFHRAVREVRSAIGRGDHVDLAVVATVAGYADQPHLTRDFTQRLGVSPRRWIGEEFRNLQAHARGPEPNSNP